MDDNGRELLKEASAVLRTPGVQLSDGFRREIAGKIQSYLNSTAAIHGEEWVSVGNKLPESQKDQWSDPVIALADNGEIFKLSCMGSYWQRSGAFVDSGAQEITDWMPIPEMPK